MENKLPRVLVISSADPYIGPGIVGLNHYNSLKSSGLEVDFMTKYPVEGHPEFISVLDNNTRTRENSLFYKGLRKIQSILFNNPLLHQTSDHCFFYTKEINPEVPVERVLSKVEKKYDVVYIMFWQGLLSFATIEALYDKLQCQFQFRCVDYSPMSGGCHFVGDCERYKIGCGKCPGIKSGKEDDFTRWNVDYRKRVYEKVKPIVYGNSYMNKFYHQSYLLKDYNRCEVVLPLMDNDTYRPLDADKCRQEYNITYNKKFLMFAGCQFLDDERKGMKYLLKALKIFYNNLSDNERESVLLVLAGHDVSPIKNSLLFDYIYLGYVKQQQLPAIYSMSNVYLSPSVNDAGPSMVNQSLSCGTPVVAFEMGTALDVVKDRGTGYCAKLRNSEDFAKGIELIFRMPTEKYIKMRNHCRERAVEQTSSKSHVDHFLEIWRKYKE